MNCIILGATRGLGLTLVQKFLKEGHTVAAGIPETQPPEVLQRLAQEYDGRCLILHTDVTDEEGMQRAAEESRRFLSKADALVNAAGVLLPGDRTKPLYQCDVGELRKTFEVNAIGAIIAVKCFYPLMREGGRFLTITSEGVGVKNPGDWVPCYALSKTAATKVAGIMNLMVKDVDFYSMHPGRMNTEMGRTTAQIEPEESAEGIYGILTGSIPVSREEWYIDYKGDIMDA